MGTAARRLSVASALIAVTVSAVGCASTVSGSGHLVSAGRASSSADFPSQIATPTLVLSTSAASPSVPATTTAQAPAPPTDITDLHFRVPRGFAKSTVYHPVRPLESRFVAAYAVPKNERSGLDVLSILLYRLPKYRPVGTIAQQKGRVLAYNREAQAKRLNGIRLTQVDGRIAFQESLFEQPNYRYVSWFVFGTRHVLQVSCQVDQQVNKLATACGSWLASIRLS